MGGEWEAREWYGKGLGGLRHVSSPGMFLSFFLYYCLTGTSISTTSTSTTDSTGFGSSTSTSSTGTSNSTSSTGASSSTTSTTSTISTGTSTSTISTSTMGGLDALGVYFFFFRVLLIITNVFILFRFYIYIF